MNGLQNERIFSVEQQKDGNYRIQFDIYKVMARGIPEKAYADLYASAPELLEALKNIKELSCHCGLNNSLRGKHDVKNFAILINQIVTKCEEVLSKAENN